jgi:GrpB-like predicted nucleotidyltransferase (UPF0157 family)
LGWVVAGFATRNAKAATSGPLVESPMRDSADEQRRSGAGARRSPDRCRERRAITIADYDPSWPARFEAEHARVRDALCARAIRIEHIGSTAVPGLAAKPIIDLLATVADPDDETVSVPALTAVGYELRVRELGHRMFRTAERDVHVHVWGDDDPAVTRYVRFRDRLRRSAEDRQTYEQLKRDLARRHWSDMNHDADAKGSVIEEILARADS